MPKTMRTGLTLRQKKVGEATVVRVKGSAGIHEAEKLQGKLEAIAAEGVTMVVLDLTGMDFICSQGLGAIITGHLRIRRNKGELRLVNPQPAVKKLLETTRLTKLFGIYDSVAAATS